MTRDGPVLRPGTRSYARSWIRDGAMMSRVAAAARPRQHRAPTISAGSRRTSSTTARCRAASTARGADPVPENDSNGELIFLAAEVFRYTGDRALLETMWPHVEAAVRYMDACARPSAPRANLTAQRRMLYGLLPPSISHEGYSSKPAYSYWDDFWGLLGYKDAVAIADSARQDERGARIRAQRKTSSGATCMPRCAPAAAVHGIAYVPGAADLGDFDATSTTIALGARRRGAQRARRSPARDVRALLAQLHATARRQRELGRLYAL